MATAATWRETALTDNAGPHGATTIVVVPLVLLVVSKMESQSTKSWSRLCRSSEQVPSAAVLHLLASKPDLAAAPTIMVAIAEPSHGSAALLELPRRGSKVVATVALAAAGLLRGSKADVIVMGLLEVQPHGSRAAGNVTRLLEVRLLGNNRASSNRTAMAMAVAMVDMVANSLSRLRATAVDTVGIPATTKVKVKAAMVLLDTLPLATVPQPLARTATLAALHRRRQARAKRLLLRHRATLSFLR